MNEIIKWIFIALAIEVVVLIIFSIINRAKASNITINIVHDKSEPEEKVGLYLSAKRIKDLQDLEKYTRVTCSIKVINK